MNKSDIWAIMLNGFKPYTKYSDRTLDQETVWSQRELEDIELINNTYDTIFDMFSSSVICMSKSLDKVIILAEKIKYILNVLKIKHDVFIRKDVCEIRFDFIFKFRIDILNIGDSFEECRLSCGRRAQLIFLLDYFTEEEKCYYINPFVAWSPLLSKLLPNIKDRVIQLDVL